MNFQFGQVLRVTGKSQKGKSRVKQWGKLWKVTRVEGSRIMIVAETDIQDGNQLPDSARWVDRFFDSDIEIQEVVS